MLGWVAMQHHHDPAPGRKTPSASRARSIFGAVAIWHRNVSHRRAPPQRYIGRLRRSRSPVQRLRVLYSTRGRTVNCSPLAYPGVRHSVRLPCHTHPPHYPAAIMRFLKLYEHPEFKAEPEDVTLLSTICFVLALALAGAIFILAGSCLLFWDDCSTSKSSHLT